MADEPITTTGDAEADLWLDNEFTTGLDTRDRPSDVVVEAQERLNRTADEPAPVQIMDEPAPPAPVADEPERIELEDGASVTIEKTNKGWRATLDPANGSGPQVYYGKSRKELDRAVYKAQVHATKKIRELNKELLVGGPAPAPAPASTPAPAAQPTVTAAVRSGIFTADEIARFNLQYKVDPVATQLEINNLWFERTTGTTPAKLAEQSSKGDEASKALWYENQAKLFFREHPDYPQTDEALNLLDMYLQKHNMTYSAKDLGIAYETLVKVGLIVPKVSQQTVTIPAPAGPSATPAPASPDQDDEPAERIAPRTQRRRVPAGYGLRASEVTNAQPDATEGPSDEDLENLSDADINALYSGALRMQRNRGRR